MMFLRLCHHNDSGDCKDNRDNGTVSKDTSCSIDGSGNGGNDDSYDSCNCNILIVVVMLMILIDKWWLY